MLHARRFLRFTTVLLVLAAMTLACRSTKAPHDSSSSTETSFMPAPIPVRTAAKFLADFDQAVGYIEAFSVHKDLSARRLGIDHAREFARLRSEIDENTDLCAFSDVLLRALNLVQDLHVGTMDSAYLKEYGTLQSRFNIAEHETYAAVEAAEKACAKPAPQLDLPIAFINGRYMVYADFSYRGEQVERGTTLTRYNGEEISAYIRANLDRVWPVRVSPKGEVYSTRFYRSGAPEFRLGLSDSRELVMNHGDAIDWTTPRQRAVYFGSQPGAKVLYFPDHHTLYIGLPVMDEALVESINAQVDEIVRKGSRIERIAIDIRGNGGGSDMTWRRVLAHLVADPLRLPLDLRMKDSDLARKHYLQESPARAESVALLNGARYWQHNGNVIEWAPDEDSLRFTGPIYVLRDAFIYSSAANLANFANDHPQMITVGETTDLVGGAQIEPLFFKLDHSGLVFRIEPALDFSAVRTLDDFAHNQVEVPISLRIEDLFLRSTFVGDVYDHEFLLQHDPLFRAVLIHGHWSGIARSASESTEVSITLNHEGASLGLPQVGVLGWPASNTRVEGDHVVLEFQSDSGTQVMTLDYADGALSGTWSDPRFDAPASLSMSRAAPVAAVPERRVLIESAAGKLGASLLMPAGVGPFPGVVFLHGSGPQPRDASRFNAQALVERGVAALIFDKRGVGASSGDTSDIPFADLAADAVTAATWLRAQASIARVGFLGHSQGGWIGPMAANRWPDTAFVIAGSAPVVSPMRESQWDVVRRMRLARVEETQVERAREIIADWYGAVKSNDWTRFDRDMESARAEAWFSASGLGNFAEHPDASITASILQDHDYNPLPALRRVQAPVLWILSKDDESIDASETADLLAKEIAAGRDIRVQRYDGYDHSLRRLGPNGQGLRWPRLPDDLFDVQADFIKGDAALSH